jgi:methanethiol S-methyltransferase
MNRLLILIYGIIAYLGFLFTFSYLIGFVSGVIVPKNIDTGISGSLPEAILVDFFLVLLFGLTHSIMARPAFKERFTKIIPQAAERSTYVLIANATLAILFWKWQPIDTVIWKSEPPISLILFGISMFGWALIVWATLLIDHFDLFGVRQVWLNYRDREYTSPPFAARGLYKYVRHPLMLGFLIGFWFAPTMTVGHLFFCIAMTVYILIGVFFEERDLVKHLGETYSRYRKQTSSIIPWL